YVYDLTADKERLEREKAEVAVARDALKAKVDEHDMKGLNEVDRLKREIQALKEAPPQDNGLALQNARLTLALEHDLTVKQAERLRGETPEELAADVAELKELLGGEKETPPPGGRRRTGNERDDGDDNILTDKDLAGIFD